jgi:hypothetical protein
MTTIVLRILFIGNSLTAANNLPAVLEALARADTRTRIEAEVVAFPDHSLEDHWNRGDARRAIARGGWDIVVLQQGPSARPESEAVLREYTKAFDAEIRKVGARTALYMVWPASSRASDFDGVARSYSHAAADVKGLLFAVGEAWRAAWKRDAKVALYGSDGFHPSALGTYLAALVIYQGVTQRSVIGLPSPFSSIDPAVVRLLQEAAADVEPGLHRNPPVPQGGKKEWNSAISTTRQFKRRSNCAWTVPPRNATASCTSTAR